MAIDVTSVFTGSTGLSFYGFLLPWLFTFAIVFGLLSKANLFGTGSHNKQVNIALSFVIAFFVTGLGGPQLASFFVNFFGGTAVFLAGILVFLLFYTLITAGQEKPKNYHQGVIGFIFVVVVAALLFLSSTGTFGGYLRLDSATTALIFWVIIIIVAAYLITQGGGEEKKG